LVADEFVATLDDLLGKAGSHIEEGEEFREPVLDVLRYYTRAAKVGRLPVVDRVLSVVAVVYQPRDVGLSSGGYTRLLDRLAKAAHGRFPPWPRGHALSIALTAVVLTPEPIGPDEDPKLGELLTKWHRSRVVPLGMFRVNLGQGAMSLALAGGLEGRFPEPGLLADDLTARFGRFLPRIEG
jgi:hypothetical protein